LEAWKSSSGASFVGGALVLVLVPEGTVLVEMVVMVAISRLKRGWLDGGRDGASGLIGLDWRGE